MKKRQFIILGVILLIITISLVAMGGLKSMKPETEELEKEENKRYVKTRVVKYDKINSELKLTGRVTSQNYVDLSSEVQGKILRGNVSLKKGQSFSKGSLLIKIYNKEAVLALQARKSRFLNSIANLLPDFKIDFKSSYKSWMDFFEKTDITKNIPNLPEIKSSKEKIYLASRNILSDYYTIKSEEIRLTKYSIKAPFNGSFTEVYAEPGAIANPGGRIAKMIRTDKLELEVPVEVENAHFLKTGNNVEIISANGKEKYSGIINRISDFVEPKTQSVSVFISIKGTNGSNIFQGEYMTAVFSQISVANAMEVPRSAVFNHNEVFTVENGKLQKNTINILKVNEKTLIFNGLKENIQIVTEALINAVENTEVEIIN